LKRRLSNYLFNLLKIGGIMMKKQNKFIALMPGIKLLQSTSEVKACTAGPP